MCESKKKKKKTFTLLFFWQFLIKYLQSIYLLVLQAPLESRKWWFKAHFSASLREIAFHRTPADGGLGEEAQELFNQPETPGRLGVLWGLIIKLPSCCLPRNRTKWAASCWEDSARRNFTCHGVCQNFRIYLGAKLIKYQPGFQADYSAVSSRSDLSPKKTWTVSAAIPALLFLGRMREVTWLIPPRYGDGANYTRAAWGVGAAAALWPLTARQSFGSLFGISLSLCIKRPFWSL